MLSISNPKPCDKNERIVTLEADGERWRYGVRWSPEFQRYRVRAIDEGWWTHVSSDEVLGVLSARNIAIVATERDIRN